MTWQRVVPVAEVAPDSTTRFRAGAHEYLLARTADGTFYAADLSCTHAFAELDTTSALIGTQITCYSHGATFDLRDAGRVVSRTTTGHTPPPLRTFPTRIQDGVVWVDIPDDDKPPEPPLGG